MLPCCTSALVIVIHHGTIAQIHAPTDAAGGMPIFVRWIVLKVRPQMPEGSRYDCFSAAGFRAAGKFGAGTLTLGAMISQ